MGILFRRVLVPGLLAQFVGWTQLLIVSAGGLNTEINATHPRAYNNRFLASSEIFLVARGKHGFRVFLRREESPDGDPSRGVLRRELHASQVWLRLLGTALAAEE